MASVQHGSITLQDFEPTVDDVSQLVLAGLLQPNKTLPCKLLYDERGSQIFDEICTLDEYYPTRTEIGILTRHLFEIAELVDPHARIVEPGSGSGIKTRMLLERLIDPLEYVPIDISRSQLVDSATELAALFPHLTVSPVCADYTQDFELPSPVMGVARTVTYFPGSTIGNFEPDDASQFLRRIARWSGTQGGLLIGVDLKKDQTKLEQAYNDRGGITAAFNLNLLERINRDLDGDFDLDAFRHIAVYDDARGCIEMRLVSTRQQTVHLLGNEIPFETNEIIVTEHSYKYDPAEFERLAKRAGFQPSNFWTDDGHLFGVFYLTLTNERQV